MSPPRRPSASRSSPSRHAHATGASHRVASPRPLPTHVRIGRGGCTLHARSVQRTRPHRSGHGATLAATPGPRQALLPLGRRLRACRSIAMRITIAAKNPTRRSRRIRMAMRRRPAPGRAAHAHRSLRRDAHADAHAASTVRRPRHAPPSLSAAAHATHAAVPSPRRSAPRSVVRRLAPRRPGPKRKPAAQGGRFGCRNAAARLSGRLPRAARRSRPASAGRSTVPARRSPARRSSLRRTRPR